MEEKKAPVIQTLTAEEKKALAIKLLTKEYPQRIAALPTCELYSHPFKLASLDFSSILTYLGANSPSNTLEQMCYHLQINVAPYGEIEPDNIRALRIIYGQENGRSKCKVYFEALTIYKYYLCGKINNLGGIDSKCNERMEIIFDYLAELANIKVEKVDINAKIHQSAKALIGIAKRADCGITRRFSRVSDRD